MKIKLWDLECSNLNADFGIVLCGGVKVYGEKKPEVISISDFKSFKKDPTDDKELVQAIADNISDADVWVTWYGSRFDKPYLNSRLLYHRLKPLPPVPHIDGWRVARNNLKIHSNRLASVSEFLGLANKTPIVQSKWVRALAGHKPSLQYIIEHCRQDIVVLEEAYEILRPLVAMHPSMRLIDNLPTGCPVCGSEKTHRRGTYVALTRTYQRFQCQQCGTWFRDEKPERSTKARSLV